MCKKQYLVRLSALFPFVSSHGKKHHCIVITLIDCHGCIDCSKPVDAGRILWCQDAMNKIWGVQKTFTVDSCDSDNGIIVILNYFWVFSMVCKHCIISRIVYVAFHFQLHVISLDLCEFNFINKLSQYSIVSKPSRWIPQTIESIRIILLCSLHFLSKCFSWKRLNIFLELKSTVYVTFFSLP